MPKKAPTVNISDEISDETFIIIEKLIGDTVFGSVQLIVQDCRLIQLERHDKIRLTNNKAVNPTGQRPTDAVRSLIRTRIQQSLQGITYGQVSLHVQQGKIVQIEKTQKQRLVNLQGLDGDGI